VTVNGINNGFGQGITSGADLNLPPYRTLNYCIRLR
jgi:hypothetical protein